MHILRIRPAVTLKAAVASILLAFLTYNINATETVKEFTINYRVNRTEIEKDYLDNAGTLKDLQNTLVSAGNIESVEVFSTASPEGPLATNERLSTGRGLSLGRYIASVRPELASRIVYSKETETWNELSEVANSDAFIFLRAGERESLRAILNSGLTREQKQLEMKKLAFWCDLNGKFFYNFRYARVRIVFEEGSGNKDAAEIENVANEPIRTSSLIYFRKNSGDIDSNYYGNGARLDNLEDILSSKSGNEILSVKIFSTASPEGPKGLNKWLSRERGISLGEWMAEINPAVRNVTSYKSTTDAWKDMIATAKADRNISETLRTRIIEIASSNETSGEKLAKLCALPEYQSLSDRYFPHLRYAKVEITWRRGTAKAETEPAKPAVTEPKPVQPKPAVDTVAVPVPADTAVVVPADTTSAAPADTMIHHRGDSLFAGDILKDSLANAGSNTSIYGAGLGKRYDRNMIVAAKTNLLYDAASALNFELEAPIGNRWSVMVEDIFPWWETGNKYCFQNWEMGAEARFWFKPWDGIGREKLRGFFVGPYVMSGKYDFQYDKQIDYQGEYWSTGLSAGYVMPIGKRKNLNLEFSLSVGYLRSDYRHYMPTDDYSKLIRDPYNVGTVSYFGPTKAKVSLVVPITIPAKKGVSYE